MGPEIFYTHAQGKAPGVMDSVLIGPVLSPDATSATHQLAIVTNTEPGQESCTVLSADLDPNNNALTTCTVNMREDEGLQPGDAQMGEEFGEKGVIDLRFIPTAMGEAEDITAIEQPQPEAGIYVGGVTTAAGQVALVLYTATFPGEADYMFDADEYPEYLES